MPFRLPIILGLLMLILVSFGAYTALNGLVADTSRNQDPAEQKSAQSAVQNEGGPELKPHPLTIEALRAGDYPGSDLIIEQTLTPGSNYKRYIASYKSEGLKIYGLLTIPNGQKPSTGWPVIIFNHGFIPPDVYQTTERYIAYTD